METWATFSIIDHLKPIGDQTQEELAQLEAVDYSVDGGGGVLLGNGGVASRLFYLAFPQGFT